MTRFARLLIGALLVCALAVPDADARSRRRRPRRAPKPAAAAATATQPADAAASAAPDTAEAQAERGAKPEKPPRSVTHYDARLFGPDLPLGTILARAGLELADGKVPEPRIVILKAQRRLELWSGDLLVKVYRAQLGSRPGGDKVKVKDGRTPEGEYAICKHQGSRYHRGLLLNYPNRKDVERGREQGLVTDEQAAEIDAAVMQGRCPPQNTRLGGFIMIHGQSPDLTSALTRAQRKGDLTVRKGHVMGDGDPANLSEVWDWTQGCVALLNPDIRELYDLLPDGTPVEIRPSGDAVAPHSLATLAELVKARPPRPAPPPALAAAPVAPERKRPIGIH